jgi:hypothetical protein
VRRAAATTAVGAIAIVSALALGGIASAGNDTQLTRKQFIKKADKICLATATEANQIAQQYFGALGPDEDPDPETLAAFWDEYGPVVQDEIDDIRALNEPNADRRKVKKILAAVQDALDTVIDDASVLLDSAPFAKADALAQAYGFKVCGSDTAE